MMSRLYLRLSAIATVLWCIPALAEDIKLPNTLSFSAYDTGTTGFNTAVAIGKMMKEKLGINLRVLPVGNDVGRLSLLRDGRAEVSSMGIGGYFAQEGLFEFSVKEWGPQPIRLLLASYGCDGLSVGVAADIGVRTIGELRGKRVAAIVGSPSFNQNTLAVLAFGGLTANDIKLVEFSGQAAAWKGMLNNDVDAAFGTTTSPSSREMDSSPRGLLWPPAPTSDTAGWRRLNEVAPFFAPKMVSCGVGLSPGGTELPTYPYPMMLSYGEKPADLIRAITRAMIIHYESYKSATEATAGLEAKRQNLSWIIPYHEGAISALRDAGLWTAANDSHNQRLIERQKVLSSAWQELLGRNPPDDKRAFSDAWRKARNEALLKAGME